jgi:hypothetical protein
MATIQTVNNGDSGLVARTKINDNFSAINTELGAITVTLQAAYDDSSAGTIITDATRGAFKIQRGSAADSDIIFDARNGVGSTVFSIAGDGTLVGQIGADAKMARIGTPTYPTIQNMQDTFHSSGSIDFAGITDAGGGNIDVPAGSGLIRATASATAQLLSFDWPASSGLAIPSDTIRYVGIEYNAGSPQVTVRTTNNFNYYTDFILGTIINEGGVLHIENAGHVVGDHANTMIQRIVETVGIARANNNGGIILSETGTRNVAMSAGVLWERLSKFTISALDTSVADTFDRYYRDGVGGHTKQSSQTQWNNTQYDDGTGTLATLGANKYGVQWFYVSLEAELVSMFGTVEHNSLAEAEDENPPTDLPNRLVEHSILIGSIIFVKSAGTASIVRSAFDSPLGGAVVTDHGSLGGLSDDDHSQYALLAGRATGQTLIGGTAASENLTLQSTAHATKGSLLYEENLDAFTVFGRVRIDSRITDIMYISHYDNSTFTNYALRQDASGQTILNGVGSVKFSLNNAPVFAISAGYLLGTTSGSATLANETSSSTNPTLIPYQGDYDTGIGGDGANSLSIITGGLEGIKLDASQNSRFYGQVQFNSSGDGIHWYTGTTERSSITQSSTTYGILVAPYANGYPTMSIIGRAANTEPILKLWDVAGGNVVWSISQQGNIAFAPNAYPNTDGDTPKSYDISANISGQLTGHATDPTFDGIYMNVTETGRTSTGEANLINLQVNSVQAIKLGINKNLTLYGDLNLGDSTLAGDRTINITGSATNVNATVSAKGLGGVTYTNDTSGKDVSILGLDSNSNYIGILVGSEINHSSNLGATNFEVRNAGATDSTTINIHRLYHHRSTPAAGVGVGMEFATSTGASNAEVGASIHAIATDVTAASEDFDLVFYLMAAGTAISENIGTGEVFRLKSTGNIALKDGGNFEIGTGTGTQIATATTQKLGFYGATPIVRPSAYTRNATVVESRTLLASASATTTNNNNVLAALIADLQSLGLIG